MSRRPIQTAKELGFNIVAAVGRGFAMPADVPKEAAAAMEAALKRACDSQAYKEYSHRNMLDNNYLTPPGLQNISPSLCRNSFSGRSAW